MDEKYPPHWLTNVQCTSDPWSGCQVTSSLRQCQIIIIRINGNSTAIAIDADDDDDDLLLAVTNQPAQ